MNDEVYSFALKNTLNEIKNVCPDVSNTFIFKDGKILAKDETTTEENIKHTMNAFNGIAERADALGELQTVTFQGSKARVNIACQNDFYLTTVASKEADEKYVATLTRVLIPTVIKLVDKLHPATADGETVTTESPEPVMENDNEECAVLWAPLAGHAADIYFNGYYNMLFLYYMERFLYLAVNNKI